MKEISRKYGTASQYHMVQVSGI